MFHEEWRLFHDIMADINDQIGPFNVVVHVILVRECGCPKEIV